MNASRFKEILGWLLLTMLVVGLTLVGELFGSQATDKPVSIAEDTTAPDAYTLIQENADNPAFVIIDVRTAEEFDKGYIENAINIDYYSESFKSQIKALDRDASYLVYCRSGNRSGQTMSLMAVYGFREVYNLADGIQAWQTADLPVVVPETTG